MSKDHSVVAVFSNHEDAEAAVRELGKANFDLKKLSIVGKDFHEEQHVVGYYNAGDRVKFWGKHGAFWGGLWGMLFGSAFFLIPAVGPIMVLGPLAATIVSGLEGAVVAGGFSALGAALYSLGIPKDSVIRYERELTAGKFLVLAHGTPSDLELAKSILGTKHKAEVSVHAA